MPKSEIQSTLVIWKERIFNIECPFCNKEQTIKHYRKEELYSGDNEEIKVLNGKCPHIDISKGTDIDGIHIHFFE